MEGARLPSDRAADNSPEGHTIPGSLHHVVTHHLPFVLICLLFFSIALHNITVPEVSDSENHEPVEGFLLITDPPTDISISSFSETALLRFFDRYFPIAGHVSFAGATEIYMQIPIFVALGTNRFSLRLLPILMSFCGLVAIFSVCKSWFGRTVANLSCLLLASHPVFIFWSRQGHDTEAVFMIPFFWMGLYFFNKYRLGKRRNTLPLCLGSLLFGLGYSFKITFLYYLVAMAVTLLLIQRRRFMAELNFRRFLLGIAWFLLGNTLTIIYYLRSGAQALRLMLDSLFSPTPNGISNLDYFTNLSTRFEQFYEVILQGELWDHYWFRVLCNQTERPAALSWAWNYVFAFAFFAAFASLPFLIGRNIEYPKKKVGFVYVFFIAVFLQVPFTISALSPHHLLVLYPFPQIILSLSLCSLASVFRRRRLWIIAWVIVGACVLFNLVLSISYHRQALKSTRVIESPWEEYSLSYELGKGNLFISPKPNKLKDGFTPPKPEGYDENLRWKL